MPSDQRRTGGELAAVAPGRPPVLNPTHVYTPGGLIGAPRDGHAPAAPDGQPIPEILRTADQVSGGFVSGGPGQGAPYPGAAGRGGSSPGAAGPERQGPGAPAGGRGQDRPPAGWAGPPPPRPGYQP